MSDSKDNVNHPIGQETTEFEYQPDGQETESQKPVGDPVLKKVGKNGGSLWAGPCPNPVPGPGRPKSRVRRTTGELYHDILKRFRLEFKNNPESFTRAELIALLKVTGAYSIGAQVHVKLDSTEVLNRIAQVTAKYLPPAQWSAWLQETTEAVSSAGTTEPIFESTDYLDAEATELDPGE